MEWGRAVSARSPTLAPEDQSGASPSDDCELSHGSDRVLLSIPFTVYHPLCYAVHNVHKVYGVNT